MFKHRQDRRIRYSADQSCRGCSGFSLVEALCAVAFLLFSIIGFMRGFVYFSQAAVISDNKMHALTEAQTMMEDIRGTSFDSIFTNYGFGNWVAYDMVQINGQLFVRVSMMNPDLVHVEVIAGWESVPNRMVGGALDADGNRISPVAFFSAVARR